MNREEVFPQEKDSLGKNKKGSRTKRNEFSWNLSHARKLDTERNYK